ncbi:uncharacterized protein (DUF488 family) [Methanolinea mesophila]|uniref:DUF488 domain-containing protein n=1 Tax=Methanolinea mesophila TaxID=547055 RepID=UPI001AE2A418|nr:DUF488 domain-containing protein [Methanolinea mesophila]MBP1929588.1 uncharacterized protein (DUF488 family) [Methanolinea mesophila]
MTIQAAENVPDPGDRSPRDDGLPEDPAVFTIGHSTHTLEEFIGILKEAGISLVIDVRTVPRSRHNPWFNREDLAQALRDSGIGYVHCAGLGGFRHPVPLQESVNKGWKHEAFRAYADYMQTDGFWASLHEAMDLARSGKVALMCAEAVPWHCHRSLIADALTISGVRVVHILDAGTRMAHHLTPFARVAGGRISYPKDPGQETLGRFIEEDNAK